MQYLVGAHMLAYGRYTLKVMCSDTTLIAAVVRMTAWGKWGHGQGCQIVLQAYIPVRMVMMGHNGHRQCQ